MTEMWVNMGPQHPMTHGCGTSGSSSNGEIITEAEPVIGYLHRGWEKMVENRDLPADHPAGRPALLRSSLTWSHLYCRTVEELMELEVPDRAQWIRS